MRPHTIATLLAALAVVSCDRFDPNSRPIYGKETGLPVNCRAYVQVAVDSYRARTYPVDEIFMGLERNCGLDGQAWGQRN